MMDNQVILVEGIGYAKDNPEEKVHHAVATISYHPEKSSYIMRSYTHEGLYTDATLEVLGNNAFQWHFEVPEGRILYQIENDGNTWTETGSFQNEAGMSFPFFNMSIKKTDIHDN